jgi:hypothetical protein
MDYVEKIDSLFDKLNSHNRSDIDEFKKLSDLIKSEIIEIFTSKNRKIISLFKELEKIPIV